MPSDDNPYQSAANWLIGSQIDFGQIWHPFNGIIDEVRIYNRVLSESEIQQLYGQPPPPITISFRDKENHSREVKGAAADGASQVIIQISNCPPNTTKEQIDVSVADGDGQMESDKAVAGGVFTQTYTAPEYYARDGHPEDITQAMREIGLTVRVQGQEITHPKFRLIKPPIVLLHGLWSSSKTWNDLRSKLITNHGYYGDWQIVVPSYPNDQSLADNNWVINTNIKKALDSVKDSDFVAKKADVVAHSMGGVLAKKYGTKVNIHSITTVATPHYGSPAANILWELVDDRWLNLFDNMVANVFNSIRCSATSGAVEDLRTTLHVNQIEDVPPYAITGITSITDPNEISLLMTLRDVLFFAGLVQKETILNQFIFGFERNDWLVEESSQEGGLTGDDTDVGWHLSETSDDEVHQKIVNFLHRTSTTASSYQTSTIQGQKPRGREYILPTFKKMGTSSGDMQIINPTAGQNFQQGDTINVSVDVTNPNAMVLIATSTGKSVLIEQAPYTFQFVIPSDMLGQVTITAGASDDVGFIGSDEVTINVSGTANLTDIQIYPEINPLVLPLGVSAPLNIAGFYDDSVTRDITASGSGTTYNSSNPAIVEVSPDGLLTIMAQGESIITVANSGVTKDITVIGKSAPELTPAPDFLNFGTVTLGSPSTTQTFKISNSGNADLQIDTLSLSGTDVSEFAMQNDNCTGATLTITGTCTCDIAFSPALSGAKSANVTIQSNDPERPSVEVTLIGEGIIPTVIELSSFAATPSDRSVILSWTTASEIDNAGFNLYRAESEDGEYVKINASLIPAKGSPTQGASYEFIDGNVKNRTTYYYKLEDIDLNGKSTFHGPVSAMVKKAIKN